MNQSHEAAITEAAERIYRCVGVSEDADMAALIKELRKIVNTQRAKDREEIERLKAALTEWRCSAKLYHSELRDLAEGKKVETQLGFHVEQRIAGLTARIEALESALRELTTAAQKAEHDDWYWVVSEEVKAAKALLP